jgi:hypothetical protein
MADLILSGEIADKLRDLAQRKGRTVEDVVEDMLEHYPPAQEDEATPSGSMAAFMKAALAADIHLEEDDLASRSREILDTEFVEYLKQRLDPDND